MAKDEEKSHAMEALLKDSLHAMESMEEVERLQEESPSHAVDPETETGLLERLGDLTDFAFRFARRTTGTSLKVGRALMNSQDQLRMMLAAGDSLREVAGLTVSEMAEALDLRDKSVLEAAEEGSAALPFELILRLAALVARNDPIPFILKYTRTYNPDVWRMTNDWGVGKLPLQFEREREFINIFRRKDEARKLSDEGFAEVLKFTRSAFEMSLHFIAEQEAIRNEDKTEPKAEPSEKKTAPRSGPARKKPQ